MWINLILLTIQAFNGRTKSLLIAWQVTLARYPYRMLLETKRP